MAALGLATASPFLLIAAVAIRLSSNGPILFLQDRVGLNGRRFCLVKLRTMRVNQKRLEVTASDDPLITPVGRLLRKTKLDEAPSLWNVLKGEMALVGPRPEVVSLVDWDEPAWQEVLAAKPGVTDPVTLRLRNEQELMSQATVRFGDAEVFYKNYLQRWKLDGYVRYLRRRSAPADLRILIETLLAVLGWCPGGPPTMKEILAVSPQQSVPGSGFRWWPSVLNRPARTVVDTALLLMSFVLAYLIRFDFTPGPETFRTMWLQAPVVLIVYAVALEVTGIHRIIWRYVSLRDAVRIATACAGALSVLVTLRLSLPESLSLLRVSLSVIAIQAMLSFLALTGARVFRRLAFESWDRGLTPASGSLARRTPVLLVGAGRAGIIALHEIRTRKDSTFDVRGFVDDDPGKEGSLVHGVPVLGTARDLPDLVHRLGIDRVVITIVDAAPEEIDRIVRICRQVPVRASVVPGYYDVLEGTG